ncbi:MAG: sister chromatid cohesion protein PDS5 [Polyangia bacterium]
MRTLRRKNPGSVGQRRARGAQGVTRLGLSLGLALALTLGTGPQAAAGDLYGTAGDLPEDVRALLAATDATKRREGVERLEGLPVRTAAPYLMQRLRDGDAAVRARAARALGPSAVLEAAPLLIDCTSDIDSAVRAACADAVGQFGALPPELCGRAASTLGRALGDAQYEVRLEVLRAVERLLHAQALPLAEAQVLLGPVLLRLEDENVGVRRAAVAALGQVSRLPLGREVASRLSVALLGRLSDSARDVRAESLASLGALGAREAVPAALRLLSDPAEEVRKQAVLCLGRLRAASAAPVLTEILVSGSESLQKAAAQSLGQLARAKAAQGDAEAAPPEPLSEAAAEALVKALEQDTLRGPARDALLEAGPGAVPVLLRRLQGQAPGAGPVPAAADVGTLVDLLRDLLPDLAASQRGPVAAALTDELARRRLPREQVLDALAAVGEPQSAPVFAGLLSDRDPVVRRRALVALRRPGLLDARALDALIAATRDEDAEARGLATRLLGALPGRGATSRLVEILLGGAGPGDADTRLAAVQALAQLGRAPGAPLPSEAVAALVTAVTTFREGTAEQRVRRAASAALAQAVAPFPALHVQALGPLLAALRRSESGPKPEVLSAIGGLLRGRPSESARPALLDVAQQAGEPRSTAATLALDALEALAAVRDPQTAGKLLRLLEHRDPLRRVRATAAVAALLSVAPSDALVAALLTRLSDDPDGRVAAEAAWGLGQLVRGHALGAMAARGLRKALAVRRGQQPTDAAVRCNGIAALARLGLAELHDADWLTDPDPGARANAATLLGTLTARSPGMAARLRNLAAVDEDDRVRRAAQRVLAAGPAAGSGPIPVDRRRHWLGTYQQDYDRRPLVEARYRLTLSDGLVRIGFTDHRGTAREELLPEGSCEIETLEDLPVGR